MADSVNKQLFPEIGPFNKDNTFVVSQKDGMFKRFEEAKQLSDNVKFLVLDDTTFLKDLINSVAFRDFKDQNKITTTKYIVNIDKNTSTDQKVEIMKVSPIASGGEVVQLTIEHHAAHNGNPESSKFHISRKDSQDHIVEQFTADQNIGAETLYENIKGFFNLSTPADLVNPSLSSTDVNSWMSGLLSEVAAFDHDFTTPVSSPVA